MATGIDIRAIASSIRTRLLVANAILVLLPVAGLSFARTFERELLRAEEASMVAVASSLAASRTTESSAWARGQPLATLAGEAARQLGAQLRVLDRDGRAVFDSGPEEVEKVTKGRTLLGSLDRREQVMVGDPPPRGGFVSRAEVKKALTGARGTMTRVSPQLRSVRLFIAEPLRGQAGEVEGVVYISQTTYPVLVSLYHIRNGLFRVVGASLVLSAVVGVFLSLTISRPLRKLTEGARRIAAGERGVALRLGGHSEVGELARAFDQMSRELDARLAYISELSANVSHEFKTPIASIRGAAELLRDGAADEPEARERFLTNILADTERLSLLVTRLLELSRIEAKRDPFVYLDFRALLEELVEQHRAQGGDVRLDYRASHDHLSGCADQLTSAIGNLIGNALQFSPPGAPVEVTVVDEGAALRVSVTDHGKGISEGNLPRVFDRFFTTERARGGTGIGLSIVKAVVEAHGGAVDAISRPGEGATFSLTLPRTR